MQPGEREHGMPWRIWFQQIEAKFLLFEEIQLWVAFIDCLVVENASELFIVIHLYTFFKMQAYAFQNVL